MTGEKILNYRIENLTEENQLYRSFLATHTQFSKKVIIKTVKNPSSFVEKTAFEEEIIKLSRIQHPNVVTLYDQLETDKDIYLIFEHVEGRSLGEHIRKFSGPIPEKKVIQLFNKILDAFSLAHQHKIFGGAISPSNIIIDTSENIKVLDLALNKFYNKKNLQIKDRETLFFANPETISGQDPDARSDIYSLGVLLFYMLTARHPYEDYSADTIRQEILEETLPDARKFYPVISNQIQTIIAKASSKNPVDRFQSCLDFKAALQELTPAQAIPVYTEKQPNSTKNNPILPEGSPVNAPLYVFLFLAGVVTLMAVLYSFPGKRMQSSILMDIKNTEIIDRIQDSIARAQEKKALEDSLRVFGGSKKEDSQIHFYKVEGGETLQKIAKRFLVSVDTLTSINGLKPNDKLKPRQGIKIPIKTIYKVKRDETLAQIAERFGISVSVLTEVNQLYHQALEPGEIPKPLIYEGKDIIIPLMPKK